MNNINNRKMDYIDATIHDMKIEIINNIKWIT